MNSLNNIKEMDLDSSLFFLDDIDKKIDINEYKSQLIEKLQPILDKTFYDNSNKRKIRSTYNRISFACPCCRDSYGDNNKKRGNFILSGKYANYFKCFNCGEFKRIDKFFEDFDTMLDLSTINYIQDNSNIENITVTTDNSILFDTTEINKYSIDKNLFKDYFKLEDISDNNIGKWLKNRKQYNNNFFYYDRSDNTLIIMNLTDENKVFSFQKRFFNNTSNKYKIFVLENVHNLMKTNINVPQEINNISNLFNICNCNISKPITLFEGPLDSLLFSNSIALGGANKTLPIDLPVRYWFDDDKTGKEMSIEKINNNEEVFLWGKYKEVLGLPYRKKWDLNDVIIWSKQNNIKLPDANNFFSKDSFDIIDI